MMRLSFVLGILLCGASAEAQTLYEGARLIVGDASPVIERSSIVVDGGRIVQVGELGKIKAPTLLIWGKEDIMIPVKCVEPFVRMKNCRVVMLEHCGHRPHSERPAT